MVVAIAGGDQVDRPQMMELLKKLIDEDKVEIESKHDLAGKSFEMRVKVPVGAANTDVVNRLTAMAVDGAL